MYYCDICGRAITKPNYMAKRCLCSKHMHQLYNHGKFLDHNPRTVNDLNEYKIVGNIVIFDLYDGVCSNKIAEFIIDFEDIERIKYHKWRLSHQHVVTGSGAMGTQRELSWVILGLDNRDPENSKIVVDHIDGNPLNNRKSNLRICTQSENTINRSFMSNNTHGFIGVSYKKDRNSYDPEIRLGYIRCHLGQTKSKEEAVYKRLIAEEIVFGQYCNEAEHFRKIEFTKNIPDERKEELKQITIQKLIAKGLWQ